MRNLGRARGRAVGFARRPLPVQISEERSSAGFNVSLTQFIQPPQISGCFKLGSLTPVGGEDEPPPPPPPLRHGRGSPEHSLIPAPLNSTLIRATMGVNLARTSRERPNHVHSGVHDVEPAFPQNCARNGQTVDTMSFKGIQGC
jgi:hypothetical protein